MIAAAVVCARRQTPKPLSLLQLAVIFDLMPPLGVNSPISVARMGLHAFTTSRKKSIDHVLIENAEISILQHVHLERLQFQAVLSGTYRSVSFPKSGSPVFGQTDVNSGIDISIS